MPLPRYERERDGMGPRQRRAFLYAIGFALIVGLVFGLVWITAGLAHIVFSR